MPQTIPSSSSQPDEPEDPQFESSQVVKRLVHLAARGEGETRNQAFASVVGIGSSAVEPLIALLHDEDSSIRYYTVSALADIGDPAAVEPLLTALRDEDEDVRSAAMSAIGDIGDVRGVVPLLEVLRDEIELNWVRRDAAAALGELGDLQAVEPLIDALLNDRSGAVRSTAARALGLLGDRRAVESLIQAMMADPATVEDIDDTTELEITWYSAWSLVQLGDPRSIEPLIVLLLKSPPDSLQRMVAIETLGALGDERAIPALDSVQKHERPADETLAASFDRYITQAIKSIKKRQSS